MITYLDASEQAFTEIYWNAADGGGYLIAPHYNGGVKACWDSDVSTSLTGSGFEEVAGSALGKGLHPVTSRIRANPTTGIVQRIITM